MEEKYSTGQQIRIRFLYDTILNWISPVKQSGFFATISFSILPSSLADSRQGCYIFWRRWGKIQASPSFMDAFFISILHSDLLPFFQELFSRLVQLVLNGIMNSGDFRLFCGAKCCYGTALYCMRYTGWVCKLHSPRTSRYW